MRVAREPAIVFRGGGRRWLTLRAACNAEARKKVLKKHCDCAPNANDFAGYACLYHQGDERLHAVQRRLARLYLKAARAA